MPTYNKIITIAGNFSHRYLLNHGGRAAQCHHQLAKHKIQQHKLMNLVLAGTIPSSYTYSFAVTKQGLAILRCNGTFQQLHEKWLGGGRKAEQQKRALLGFFTLTLLIMLKLRVVLWIWKTPLYIQHMASR
jgi:hypothetical protein